MASDALSPYLTSLTIFFFLLLLISDTTMADTDKNLTFRAGAMKRNNMESFTSRKLLGFGKSSSKTNSTCKSESTATNAIHVNPSPGRRRGRFQAGKSPLPWQEKIFNASEHEVPSGPNPISNR
jgi:hypothetical protein